MALTALDILVLLTVGVAGAFGLKRGFVSEVMSLAAWIVAILAVKLLQPSVSAVLVAPVGTEAGAAVLGFAIVFGLAFIVVKLVGGAMQKSTRASRLSPFDRVLGLAFGAVKGLIVATLAFLFMSLVYDMQHGRSAERPAWMTTSRTYPLLRASGAAIIDFVDKRRAQ